MKIKLSKSQWQEIGKKAGWNKTAREEYTKECPECHGKKLMYYKLKNLGTLDRVEHILPCDTCNGKGYIAQEDHDSYLHNMGVIPHPSDVNVAKKASWIKTAQNNVDIFQFIEDWFKEGYGIALVSPDNIIIDPYIDPSDYPDMILNKSGNGARVIGGKHNGCMIIFHYGQFEDNIGKDWTDIANPQVASKNADKKASISKTAGEDWMVNEAYTKQIVDELTKRGDEVISSVSHQVVVNHKIGGKILKGLLIEVWEGSYEGDFTLIPQVAVTKRILGMVDGKSAAEALDNMDKQLGILVVETNKR